MTLTKVEVRTTVGMLLTLELEDVSDGLVLKDVTGLDPVQATLVSSSFALQDGAQYHSSRREPRDISLIIGLEPDYVTTTVRDLRKTLYSYFMPKSEVSLRFYMADGLVVNAVGRVRTHEAPMFTQEPVVVISLTCFDPDFIALTPIVVEEDTVSTSTEFLINYQGTVETGIKFVMELDRNLDAFTIYHRPPDDLIRSFDFSAELLDNDILTIVTSVGSKSITRNRSAVITSLLYGMSPQSNWVELMPGNNYFRVYAVGAAIPFTIEYTPRYGGL